MREYYQRTLDKQCGQRIPSAQLLLSIRSYFTVNCRYGQATSCANECTSTTANSTGTEHHSMATTTNNSTDMQSPPVSSHSVTVLLRYTNHCTLFQRMNLIRLFVFIYLSRNPKMYLPVSA